MACVDTVDVVGRLPMITGGQYALPPGSERETGRGVRPAGQGHGRFGCVVEVPLRERQRVEYDSLRAIAIKYTVPPPVALRSGDADREYLVALQVDKLRVHLPHFALRVFRAVRVPRHAISAAWQREVGTMCPSIMRELRGAAAAAAGEPFLYVMETELAPRGCLERVAFRHAQREGRLDADAVASVARQIAVAMDVFQRRLSMRHHDLKASNVLVFDAPSIARSFPYLLKIADFGLSRTLQHPGTAAGVAATDGSLPNWMLQPVDWLLRMGARDESQLGIPLDGVGPEADVWSLGLMLVHVALQGADVTRFAHFVDSNVPVPAPPTAFFFAHVAEVVMQHELFGDVIEQELVLHVDVQDGRPWVKVFPRIGLLATVCLLQLALGNGFLPSAASSFLRKAERGPYYKALRLSKDVLVDSTRERADPEDALTDADNPSVFAFLVSALGAVVGPGGLDFIRRCLAWDPADRRRFLDQQAPGGKTMFGAALHHRFLSGGGGGGGVRE
jgi:serine/threonine protein kinase